MNCRFFLVLVFFTCTINPLKSLTISPQAFADAIYAKNNSLPEEYGEYIIHILEKFQNDDGIIEINNKKRKQIWMYIFRIINKKEKNSLRYKAACQIFKMLKQLYLYSQQKNINRKCPICLENIRDEIKLTCSHRYCYKCLMEWFAQDKSDAPGSHTKCPVCRVTISAKIQNKFKQLWPYKIMLKENLRKKDFADWQLLAQEQQEFYNEVRFGHNY